MSPPRYDGPGTTAPYFSLSRGEWIAAYARQAKDLDLVKMATEIKIRAERRTGELLADLEKHPGNKGSGRGKVRPSHVGESLKRLKDIGLTHRQSSDWQKLASIPAKEFEAEGPRGVASYREAMEASRVLQYQAAGAPLDRL